MVLVIHSEVPRMEHMMAEAPRLVRKPAKNIQVLVRVGIFRRTSSLKGKNKDGLAVFGPCHPQSRVEK